MLSNALNRDLKVFKLDSLIATLVLSFSTRKDLDNIVCFHKHVISWVFNGRPQMKDLTAVNLCVTKGFS